ncbi:MAG: prepilin peptidase [Gammaproteobacteria bacterium]|nr:prepilin peptidase [Gammaproteobacteria bacterium]
MLAAQPWAFPALLGVLGLLVGSFLNVVIHRLPIIMTRQWQAECAALAAPDSAAPVVLEPYNLVIPRSRCPHCERLIAAHDNIPVLSYLVLGGRCRHCRAGISLRYPLVEVASAALAGIVAWHFGAGWQGLCAALLTWALLALAMIDAQTQLLPDSITQPFLWLGLLLNSADVFTDLPNALTGAVTGYLLLWSVYWAFKLTTGKEGMGYGDFKLLAMLGAWLGWQALPVILLAASLVGAVVGIALIAFAGHQRNQPLPFGPYLAGAGWIALLWGEQIMDFWLGGGGSL